MSLWSKIGTVAVVAIIALVSWEIVAREFGFFKPSDIVTGISVEEGDASAEITEVILLPSGDVLPNDDDTIVVTYDNGPQSKTIRLSFEVIAPTGYLYSFGLPDPPLAPNGDLTGGGPNVEILASGSIGFFSGGTETGTELYTFTYLQNIDWWPGGTIPPVFPDYYFTLIVYTPGYVEVARDTHHLTINHLSP